MSIRAKLERLQHGYRQVRTVIRQSFCIHYWTGSSYWRGTFNLCRICGLTKDHKTFTQLAQELLEKDPS